MHIYLHLVPVVVIAVEVAECAEVGFVLLCAQRGAHLVRLYTQLRSGRVGGVAACLTRG